MMHSFHSAPKFWLLFSRERRRAFLDPSTVVSKTLLCSTVVANMGGKTVS